MSEKELEKILKAVANRRRIGILRYLKNGPATVGEVAKAIKLSVKATSRHLQLLSAAGYVSSEQHGLYVQYTLDPKPDALRILKPIL